MKARHVQDWSLVRLEDGRVGVYTGRGPNNRPVVHTTDNASNLGVEVGLDADLTVLKHPAELAFEALADLGEAP